MRMLVELARAGGPLDKLSEGLAARRMPASKTEQGQQQGHPAGCRQGRRSNTEIAQRQDLEVEGQIEITVKARGSGAGAQLEVQRCMW